jgi:ABC-type metal ion transport system substrate-binding protein
MMILMSQIILNGIALADLLNEFRAIVKDEVATLTTTATPVPDADRWEQGVKVAVEEMGIKPQTVYQQISKLPHRKLHGKLYFNRVQLRAYIEREGGKDAA